ncbi:MAG: type I restriction endonuclease subunit R, partial [Ignavibacteria bacterium]|nr:type I restriction endonuclease subunit R [Ignavibacteria bacterium]
MSSFTESIIEQAALDWLQELGYAYAFGPELACDGAHPERDDYRRPLLLGRLQAALSRLNPGLPEAALSDALHRVTRLDQSSLLLNNHAFHQLLVNGVEVEYKAPDDRLVNARTRLLDFDGPDANDWLVVNQFTVEGSGPNGKLTRRPDLVVFVNGLPLAV